MGAATSCCLAGHGNVRVPAQQDKCEDKSNPAAKVSCQTRACELASPAVALGQPQDLRPATGADKPSPLLQAAHDKPECPNRAELRSCMLSEEGLHAMHYAMTLLSLSQPLAQHLAADGPPSSMDVIASTCMLELDLQGMEVLHQNTGSMEYYGEVAPPSPSAAPNGTALLQHLFSEAGEGALSEALRVALAGGVWSRLIQVPQPVVAAHDMGHASSVQLHALASSDHAVVSAVDLHQHHDAATTGEATAITYLPTIAEPAADAPDGPWQEQQHQEGQQQAGEHEGGSNHDRCCELQPSFTGAHLLPQLARVQGLTQGSAASGGHSFTFQPAKASWAPRRQMPASCDGRVMVGGKIPGGALEGVVRVAGPVGPTDGELQQAPVASPWISADGGAAPQQQQQQQAQSLFELEGQQQELQQQQFLYARPASTEDDVGGVPVPVQAHGRPASAPVLPPTISTSANGSAPGATSQQQITGLYHALSASSPAVSGAPNMDGTSTSASTGNLNHRASASSPALGVRPGSGGGIPTSNSFGGSRDAWRPSAAAHTRNKRHSFDMPLGADVVGPAFGGAPGAAAVAAVAAGMPSEAGGSDSSRAGADGQGASGPELPSLYRRSAAYSNSGSKDRGAPSGHSQPLHSRFLDVTAFNPGDHLNLQPNSAAAPRRRLMSMLNLNASVPSPKATGSSTPPNAPGSVKRHSARLPAALNLAALQPQHQHHPGAGGAGPRSPPLHSPASPPLSSPVLRTSDASYGWPVPSSSGSVMLEGERPSPFVTRSVSERQAQLPLRSPSLSCPPLNPSLVRKSVGPQPPSSGSLACLDPHRASASDIDRMQRGGGNTGGTFPLPAAAGALAAAAPAAVMDTAYGEAPLGSAAAAAAGGGVADGAEAVVAAGGYAITISPQNSLHLQSHGSARVSEHLSGGTTAGGVPLEVAYAYSSQGAASGSAAATGELGSVAEAEGGYEEDEEEDGGEEEGEPGHVAAPRPCWHEVTAKVAKDPVTGSPCLLLVQRDVTSRAELEGLLSSLTENQLVMLSQIFPRHVIEFLSVQANSMALQASGLAGLARQHKAVTLLFMDVVSFTSMAKAVSPQQVMSFLNALFSIFDALCDVHGVHKVETAGDAYIVSSGVLEMDEEGFYTVLPSHDPADSAARVMAFAKDMLRHSRSVCLPHTGEPVQIRIGLHSGDVYSGVVGSKLPKFSLFGDAMNTSARMESTSKPGRIHVSEAAQQLLPHEQWEPTQGVMVKGKGMMETYLWVPPPEFQLELLQQHPAAGCADPAASAAAAGAAGAPTAAAGIDAGAGPSDAAAPGAPSLLLQGSPRTLPPLVPSSGMQPQQPRRYGAERMPTVHELCLAGESNTSGIEVEMEVEPRGAGAFQASEEDELYALVLSGSNLHDQAFAQQQQHDSRSQGQHHESRSQGQLSSLPSFGTSRSSARLARSMDMLLDSGSRPTWAVDSWQADRSPGPEGGSATAGPASPLAALGLEGGRSPSGNLRRRLSASIAPERFSPSITHRAALPAAAMLAAAATAAAAERASPAVGRALAAASAAASAAAAADQQHSQQPSRRGAQRYMSFGASQPAAVLMRGSAVAAAAGAASAASAAAGAAGHRRGVRRSPTVSAIATDRQLLLPAPPLAPASGSAGAAAAAGGAGAGASQQQQLPRRSIHRAASLNQTAATAAAAGADASGAALQAQIRSQMLLPLANLIPTSPASAGYLTDAAAGDADDAAAGDGAAGGVHRRPVRRSTTTTAFAVGGVFAPLAEACASLVTRGSGNERLRAGGNPAAAAAARAAARAAAPGSSQQLLESSPAQGGAAPDAGALALAAAQSAAGPTEQQQQQAATQAD